VDEQIGRLAGVSCDTFRRVQEIEEEAPKIIGEEGAKELNEDLWTGKTSVNEAIDYLDRKKLEQWEQEEQEEKLRLE
jgi:hypothetical protein